MTDSTARYTFTWKDAYRDWWRLAMTRSHGVPDRDDPEAVDYWWDYALSKQDDGTGEYLTTFYGNLLGQSDQVPQPRDVMQEIARRFLGLAVEVATDGRRWEEQRLVDKD